MSVEQITEPKITRVIHSVTVQLVEVEGYPQPIVICKNPDKVPHETVVDMLIGSTQMILQFLEDQN